MNTYDFFQFQLKGGVKFQMKYSMNLKLEFRNRKSLIKSLKAVTMYFEEEMSDDDFNKITLSKNLKFDLPTFTLQGLPEP